MTFFPAAIDERISCSGRKGNLSDANGRATCATLECGCVLRFQIRVDSAEKRIADDRFRTNGCGYMVAASEVLLSKLIGIRLTELQGLNDKELESAVSEILGEFPLERQHCLNLCIETLRQTLADYRASELRSWQGEDVLICTCFGVTEKRIEEIMTENPFAGVKDIGLLCGAGRGCGSCQPLIREILDRGKRLS